MFHVWVVPTDAQDLALLLEAVELYCLVSPSDGFGGVTRDVWAVLLLLRACPFPVRAQFAAASGEALLGIAEYLMEDVLLVSSGAAVGAGSGTGSAATISSSSSRPGARAGGGNPSVTLEHRIWWAQDAIDTLAGLMQQQALQGDPVTADYWKAAGSGAAVAHSLLTSSPAPRLLRLLEAHYRALQLLGERPPHLHPLLPCALPSLHVVASSPGGAQALLCAIHTAVKRQQVLHTVLEELVKAGGQLEPAAAGVVAALPGPIGQAVAQQLRKHAAAVVCTAMTEGMELAILAARLMERAAALLDPVLAPLAAYLAATQLPPGQDSKPWAVEAAAHCLTSPQTSEGLVGSYKTFLMVSPTYNPPHSPAVTEELERALVQYQAAAAQQQATKLVTKAGGGAAEMEQLCQQLQGLWLGRGAAAGPSTAGQEAQAASEQPPAATTISTHSSSSSPVQETDVLRLPFILRSLCLGGKLQEEEILAAGDPASWSSALGSSSEADYRVASTALLVACKAAGAVAQLPTLLQQLWPIVARQAWGRSLLESSSGDRLDWPSTEGIFSNTAAWALQMTPVVSLLLPVAAATELQAVAALEDWATSVLTPATCAHVLGLLGHVVAPDAPGCSYPGCCNLEGRSEALLPLQACSKCRGARYCCREHQVAHWKSGHKEVCRAAQAASQEVLSMAAAAST